MGRVFPAIIRALRPASRSISVSGSRVETVTNDKDLTPLGLIAGNGTFPLRFAEEARKNGRKVVALCHCGETDERIEDYVSHASWIKLGELGKLIDTFKSQNVCQVAMAGGIDRVKHFGSVKLDARGAKLLFRLKSAKDDVIMRGIADELQSEGIEVIDCTIYLKECLAREGVLTKSAPSDEEREDIRVGVEAIKAMSSQDIGQVVVVREGVIVAVEAAEGTSEAIRRGGRLAKKGAVVVKFAKPTQDMRFDVPTVGVRTIEIMAEVKARVLALEARRCLILDESEVIKLANKHRISIIGCPPLMPGQA
jgi:DUF1009 family protein